MRWCALHIARCSSAYLQFSFSHCPFSQMLKTHILFLVPVWRQRFLVLVSVLETSCVVAPVRARPRSSVRCPPCLVHSGLCSPSSHGSCDRARHVSSTVGCGSSVEPARVSVPRVFPLLLRAERQVPSPRSLLFHAPLLQHRKVTGARSACAIFSASITGHFCAVLLCNFFDVA